MKSRLWARVWWKSMVSRLGGAYEKKMIQVLPQASPFHLQFTLYKLLFLLQLTAYSQYPTVSINPLSLTLLF